jgi:putative RNA 2'-phosphotransferase
LKMDDKRLVHTSKFLSKYLRHEPEALGLTLAPGGWVEVEALLEGAAAAGFPITWAELEEVVARNDKKRFSFDVSGERIRANQGHSVDVDLQLEPREPPAVLYHGAPEWAVVDILADCLRKMSRHHVHLSIDVPTAKKVGARRGKPVVLVVDAAAMHRDGHTFYCSDNGVWLVDEVPRKYLRLL